MLKKVASKPSLKPIAKRSVEDLTTEVIRAEILSGALRSGSRLTEMQLSGQLEVSRATIRTALHQLVSEDLVVQVPYTGWMVASLTAEDAWELYTLRGSLESLGARLAARNLTVEGRRDIEEALAGLRRTARRKSAADIAEADFAFHKQIILLARHVRLTRQYNLVEQQVRLSILSSNALLGDLTSVVAQHEPIAQAILNGSADEAARLAEAHNHSEGEKLVSHLRRAQILLVGTA